jgi:ribosomal protein S18 acetylase RimI-like enzyme
LEVRRVQADEWEPLREVRLRSLADAPEAFATTHAEAAARSERWWREWAARAATDVRQAIFLAWDGTEAIGIGGAYGGPARFDVVSMWTDPAWRGRGVGAALLQAAIAFAGDAPVFLSVTENNDAARRLYERHGFVPTGHTEPLRSNPHRMIDELRLER